VKCRSCSAEIDAKAIVCYRCGAPTTDPATLRPARREASGSRATLWVVLAVVLMGAIGVAIYLTYFRPV